MISPVMPTYARAPVSFVSGKGCWLEDVNGEQWLDAGAGIAVSVLGHAHPRLVSALKSQAESVWHTSNLYRIPEQERLAAMLVDSTFADTVFFTNSGAEACEAAVKTARRHYFGCGLPEKNEIIAMKGSFHGRTLGMISVSGNPKHTEGFNPLAGGFTQVAANDIEAVDNAVSERTAAIMAEPVLGEGGIIPLSDLFLKQLRELCDQREILLILDEVQCGIGRTGRLFAHEWAGIEPDIMAVGKGIGGGFPLGACLATEEAAQHMVAGTHGSTYGGNPLACRVGQEVMSIVANEEFLQDVRRRSGFLRQRLEAIVATNPEVFSGVRGSGFMLGLICKPPNTDVIDAVLGERLLLVPGGGNVVRILPPLNMEDVNLSEVCNRISAAATKMKAKADA